MAFWGRFSWEDVFNSSPATKDILFLTSVLGLCILKGMDPFNGKRWAGGGSQKKRSYTFLDIAKAKGVTVHAVKKAVQRGKVDFDSLKSVSGYIGGERLHKEELGMRGPSGKPDLEHDDCSGWIIDVEDAARRHGFEVALLCTLRKWILKAPYAHPFWDYYSLELIHLRGQGGVVAAEVLVPGATHEVLLSGLFPGDAIDGIIPPPFTPYIFTGQFMAKNDSEAVQKVDFAAVDVVMQVLSPEERYRGMWVERFSSSTVQNKKGDVKR